MRIKSFREKGGERRLAFGGGTGRPLWHFVARCARPIGAPAAAIWNRFDPSGASCVHGSGAVGGGTLYYRGRSDPFKLVVKFYGAATLRVRAGVPGFELFGAVIDLD